MNIKQAKEIDLVDYLAKLGIQPERIEGANYWYCSPLRSERTASFRVDRKKNLWKDWGSGEFGDLIAFGTQYHKCDISGFLERLGGLAGKPVTLHKDVQKKYADLDDEAGKISVLRVKPIASLPLIKYYRERRIPDAIAQAYLKEVHYQYKGKQYYALGLPNDAGGFALRNQYIKAASKPNDATFMDNKAKDLAVFEGMFDFLSYKAMHHQKSEPHRNFLILNSTSFFNLRLPLMQAHDKTHLYLDNGNTGDELTEKALKLDPQKFTDHRGLYRGHGDFNEWLVSLRPAHRLQHKPTT